MLNKNAIIVIAIVVVMATLGFVFLSPKDSSNQDAAVLEHGVKKLTRESAATMIESYLKVKEPRVEKFGEYNEQQGNFRAFHTEGKFETIRELEAAGLVKVISEEKAFGNRGMNLFYDFTEQAKAYFVAPEEDEVIDDKEPMIQMAELASVEVTGLTEPSDNFGTKSRRAEFTAQYRPTPFGKILDEEEWSKERKGSVSFVLYDDGWRIR